MRGVTIQPIQDAGRLEDFDPATDRLTLTEIRRKILEQTRVFRAEDIIPVPCHPDSLAMAYALKLGGKITPLTSLIPPNVLINAAGNTILYEQEAAVRDSLFKLFATHHSPRSGAGSLRELLCCLPKVFVPDHISYENVFRIIIMQFIDAHSFDVRSVKKTCVHIVHPDGRLIPFDTYNLFYRDGLEQTRLAPLRHGAVSAPSPPLRPGISSTVTESGWVSRGAPQSKKARSLRFGERASRTNNKSSSLSRRAASSQSPTLRSRRAGG